MNCGKDCTEAKRYDYTALDKALEGYGQGRGSLITILQKAQDIYGYLPRKVIEYIADRMEMKTAKVYGVATFYARFRFKPIGKYLVMLCMGTACHVKGAKAIEAAVCDELGISNGETTKDGLFTLNTVACVGCCGLSPVIRINSETFGLLTGDKARDVIKEFKTRENVYNMQLRDTEGIDDLEAHEC